MAVSVLAGAAHIEVRPVFKGWDSGVKTQLASQGLDQAGQAAGQRTGARFSDGFRRASKLAVAAATTAFAGVATAAVSSGVRTAAGMETAQIAFSTMLGSAKDAKAFLAELTDFAAKTPFDLPGLQTAAQSLVSIGIDADKVIPIMTTLGDVTAGMGTGAEGVQRATVAIQQMNAAGKISAEDLNQLRDAGVPVYDLLAAATGKSVAQVSELARQGKLGRKELDQLMQALESGKGLERFSGMMEQQSTSMSGLWSTLKDTWAQGTAQMIQPLVPLIKDGLGGAIRLLTAATPKVAAGMESVVGWIRDLMAGDALGGKGPQLLDGFRAGLDTLRDSLKELGPVLRDKASELGPMLGDGLAKIRDALSDLAPTLKDGLGQLGPMLRDVGDAAPALAPTLDMIGAGLRFVADHADLVAKAMPALITAFAAFKGLQAVNSVLGRDSALGMGVQIGATLTLAASNRALAKSQKQVAKTGREANAVEAKTLLQRIRSAAATMAQRAAQLLATAATKAQAVVTRILNAVMRANPVGIVITLLVALAAGLVMAYRRSETFRRIVQGAWAGIKAAASAVVTWFKGTAWPWMSAALSAIGGAVKALWSKYWDVYLGKIVALARRVFGWVKDTGLPLIKSALQGIADKAKWLWDKGIKPAFDLIRGGVDAVKSAFQSARDGIGRIWDGLVDRVQAPIKKVMTFLQHHFVDPLNALLSKIPGVDFRITLPGATVPGAGGRGLRGGVTKAAGGVLDGWSPGRDDMHWWSPIHGGLSLAGGEAIMRPEWTAAIGKPQIDAWNAAARRGGTRAVRAAMGFAGGGILGKARDLWGWAKGKGSDALDFARAALDVISSPVKALAAFARKALSGIGGGVWGSAAAGVGRKVASQIGDYIAGWFGGGEGAPGPAPSGSLYGWRAMKAWIEAVPGLGARVTSAYRPGARTTSGAASLHGLGRAIDIVGPNMLAIARYIYSTLGPARINELIYAGGGFDRWSISRGTHRPGTVSSRVLGIHHDHVHLGIAGGGVVGRSQFAPFVADAGVRLAPGINVLDNRLGRPEPLARTDAPGPWSDPHLDVTLLVDGRELHTTIKRAEVRYGPGRVGSNRR